MILQAKCKNALYRVRAQREFSGVVPGWQKGLPYRDADVPLIYV